MHKLTLIGIVLIIIAIILGAVSLFQFAGVVMKGLHEITLSPNSTKTFEASQGTILIFAYNSTSGVQYKVISGTPVVKTTQSNGVVAVEFYSTNSPYVVQLVNPNNYPVNVTVEEEGSGGLVYISLMGLAFVLFLAGVALIIIGIILGRRKR